MKVIVGILAPILIVTVVSVCVTNASDRATRPGDGLFTMYDADASHPWNRLHQSLIGRQLKDGATIGLDQPDPLLWPESKHLLDGPTHKAAVEALDEAIRTFDTTEINDPLKRAVLQHDLWAIFDWVANENGVQPGQANSPARTELVRRLSQLLPRLAMWKRQIEELPDNYAAAVKSRNFATDFDPAKPAQPFLPPDLFDAKGPWVCISDYGRPASIRHIEFTAARSTFLTFISLPGGREATLAYLLKLNTFPKPYILNPRFEHSPRGEPIAISLNPDTPQIPKGTRVALVRQMILPDKDNQLVPTRLTESVQLRVYTAEPARFDLNDRGARERETHQTFFEFELRRQKIFAGEAGGLVSIGPDEKGYIQFQSHTFDPIDRAEKDPRVLRMNSCAACHQLPGIFSVNTAFPFGDAISTRPVMLHDVSFEYVQNTTIRAKQSRFDWGLLKGLSQSK